jgi:hypothetical protein
MSQMAASTIDDSLVAVFASIEAGHPLIFGRHIGSDDRLPVRCREAVPPVPGSWFGTVPELLSAFGPSTVASMLAKVHYPGPGDEDRSFDAEVPEPPPRTHVFTNPVDGTEVHATLEEHQDAMQPGGGVAIYGAESDSP